jgi:hypothetical protein
MMFDNVGANIPCHLCELCVCYAACSISFLHVRHVFKEAGAKLQGVVDLRVDVQLLPVVQHLYHVDVQRLPVGSAVSMVRKLLRALLCHATGKVDVTARKW